MTSRIQRLNEFAELDYIQRNPGSYEFLLAEATANRVCEAESAVFELLTSLENGISTHSAAAEAPIVAVRHFDLDAEGAGISFHYRMKH